MRNISFQPDLRPEIPTVYGVYQSVDLKKFQNILVKIDELLSKSGLEHKLVMQALEQYVERSHSDADKFYNSKQVVFRYKKFRHALRCNIARHLTGESYRAFSIRMADSALFQWFASISAFGSYKSISKSSLERYEKCFNEEGIADIVRGFVTNFADNNKAQGVGLAEAVDCETVFMDSTCIKANIHAPVDWVLLRDAMRSILLAIKTIRAQGLKHRMIAPQLLLREMNKLCINMTHTRRKKEGKNRRKEILREMKKLSKCIANHGSRYRELLANEWEKTDWTHAQARQVIRRIDNILEQLPAAIKQAHERIIGERLVQSKDKILSLYDKNAHIIIRGKAGAECEYGQGLLLAEQAKGLIVDWEIFREQPPSDSGVLIATLKRIEKHYGKIKAVCTDRGFGSESNDIFLQSEGIYNAICPKSPKQLREKTADPIFLSLQTRRSQTEGRIGIFKNVFLGKPLRSRIHECKKTAVTWCVLTHNLWVLARMIMENEKSMRKEAAANKTKLKKVA